jgi:glycine oxidase
MARTRTSLRVGILGAGVIGLSAAYELAVRRNVCVTIFDVGAPGRGASWAAAGMLAPAFEAAAEPGVHPRLFDLCLQSAALWPAFAAELTARSGGPVGFDPSASLAVAPDTRQAAKLARIRDVLGARGIAHVVLDAEALLALEPALSPSIPAGLELPTDMRVDNRTLVGALLGVLRAVPNVRFETGPAPLKSEGGCPVLANHDAILAAAGWQTAGIRVEQNGKFYRLENWDTTLGAIDCHSGQMLAVKAGPGAPQRVVRSGHLYLVPRGERVVIGATTEPGRVLEAPEPEAINGLKAEAARLCPGLAAAITLESWAGVRPGTPDHAPFLGRTAMPGLFVAAGHYRNGILLAPVTAQILADQILGEDAGELAAGFSPRRAFAATA